ncbi:hypothetical protein O6H91_05G100200 [Diphasiastrum complanatum]|nr:hypothetical protein O6H91_05G100200 [Diphasiastrum complanatum]KAJ7556822.1 hypothetical protein O6H91_05G100200 [Diphasiastrum complanatum]
MALLLGLLRHTHLLSSQGFASAGWLGSIQPICRGMRRCRGQVMGIVGSSRSAAALAVRCLAFKMKVLYFEPEEEKENKCWSKSFPPSVEEVDSLKELLSRSDVVSLHCSLTNDTVQLINGDTLQYIKPGAFLVNTSSSHLLDDCALKQALIDGTVAGCALDGVEGPQWLEAWVREMPNVLILPRSAEYSDDVWAEIRAKAVSVLRSYFVDGVLLSNTVSDDEEDSNDPSWLDEKDETSEKENSMHAKDSEQWFEEAQTRPGVCSKHLYFQAQNSRLHSQDCSMSRSSGHRTSRSIHGKGAGKKGKKKLGRRKSQQTTDALKLSEKETNWVALQRDDRDSNIKREDTLTSIARFTSPDDKKLQHDDEVASSGESTDEKAHFQSDSRGGFGPCSAFDQLKEGHVVALRPEGGSGYYVARKKGSGRGWSLDLMSDVTTRDPATQFLVVLHNKDRFGLRSLAAGGRLLQANKKSELSFSNHSVDVWESWMLEGSTLDMCRIIHSKFRAVSLDVSIEVLAAVGEEDGVARWLR